MSSPAASQRASTEQLSERAILVVDRDEVGRTATASILRRLGFEVTEADSPKSALAQARQGRYACAILDLNLVEMSAFEVCRRLLARSQWSWTPVIFTSARQPRLDLRVSMQAGGFAYLPKPFRADHLIAVVGDALASQGPMRQGKPNRELVLARAEAAASTA
ncbi:MAG TPA: response regulator [Candidatus Dormibacteraeota bacterium]